jgi:antibiotic biosynthesis monooxygenase (ABM) superfamily enzyme
LLEVIEHLVLFSARPDAAPEDLEDLVASLRRLKEVVPGVVELTAGENFSERADRFTHGLYARFEDREGLAGYIAHPEHLAVVDKLEALTTGRVVVDYEI